jgi:hypothetical protein
VDDNVTHPSFKRKARGGYETSPRPVILFITQAELDSFYALTRATPDVSFDEHLSRALKTYLKKHAPKPPKPKRLKPKPKRK